MAETPDRITITLPARILLEVGGSTPQVIADIELPVVVLVQPGIPPVIQVAPIQSVDPYVDETLRLAALGNEMPVAPFSTTGLEDLTNAGRFPKAPTVNRHGLDEMDCPRRERFVAHAAHSWGDFEVNPNTSLEAATKEAPLNHWCMGYPA